MKTMWIATGLIIGLGVAASISATGGNPQPSRVVPATAEGDTPEGTEPSTTTTVEEVESTTTSVLAIQPLAAVPTTTKASASTTIVAEVTTTTRPWNTAGTACSQPGDSSWDSSGQHRLVCTDGTWQVAT